MTRSQFVNPFYVLLVAAGTVFVLTSISYGIMTVFNEDPARAAMSSKSGLVLWMEKHGLAALVVELAVLAAATIAAIGTDGYWTRRAERNRRRSRREPEPKEIESEGQ